MTKPTVRLLWPAKTQIRPRIRTVWSDSSLIACAFYSLQAIQRGINKKYCHTGWAYRLIWIFACHTGLIVGFVVRFCRALAHMSSAESFIQHAKREKTTSSTHQKLLGQVSLHNHPTSLTMASQQNIKGERGSWSDYVDMQTEEGQLWSVTDRALTCLENKVRHAYTANNHLDMTWMLKGT